MALLRDLVINLGAGARVALLQRLPAERIVATPPQIAALVVLGTVWVLAVHWAWYGGAGATFNPAPFASLWRGVPILLMLGWALSTTSIDESPLRGQPLRMVTLLLSIEWVVGVAATAATALLWRVGTTPGWSDPLHAAAYGVYMLGVAWPATALLIWMIRHRSARRLAHGVSAATLYLYAAWFVVSPSGPFWYPRIEGGHTQAAGDNVASEEMLEIQRERIDARLQALQPQRPGVADLFFVGFAPYAEEEVFRKELDAIHPLMDERFDTAGRSVRLLNNAATLREHPIATVTNLRRTLERIGKLMDPAEDVLLIYLTSHGSRRFELSAVFDPLELRQLTPVRLKELLDAAGIRNRVLAVSSCYSGGFIEPLRDPHTLVLTASAHDRKSFGCGNESDFTYFGKAMFEALGETFSFEDAFERARPVIVEREAALKAEHSNPQIWVGDRIRPRLTALERRLAARTEPRR